MMRYIACAVAVTFACSAPTTSPTPSPGSLIVRNTGAFDAVVYVVRDAGAIGVRISSVTANTTKGLALQRGHIPPSDVLIVSVHPIGTNTTWTSAGVSLQPGTTLVLDLRIGAGGECLHCALYAVSNAAALHF